MSPRHSHSPQAPSNGLGGASRLGDQLTGAEHHREGPYRANLFVPSCQTSPESTKLHSSPITIDPIDQFIRLRLILHTSGFI
jgi:hypothetical protein